MVDCGPQCEETLREIERYLDGEVDEAIHGRVQEHIADCGPCMERADFRRHLKELVQEKCTEDVPADVQARIRSLIDSLGTVAKD